MALFNVCGRLVTENTRSDNKLSTTSFEKFAESLDTVRQIFFSDTCFMITPSFLVRSRPVGLSLRISLKCRHKQHIRKKAGFKKPAGFGCDYTICASHFLATGPTRFSCMSISISAFLLPCASPNPYFSSINSCQCISNSGVALTST